MVARVEAGSAKGPEEGSPAPVPPEAMAGASTLTRFRHLAGGYWTHSEERWKARGLTAALALMVLGQLGTAIWINLWNKDFFNALEQRNAEGLFRQIGIFAMIVVFSMATTATHLHVKRHLQMGWRAWLSRITLEKWLQRGRQYQLQFLPGAHDNPDSRIAEDIRIATEYAVEFAHSIFYCSLLLVTFLGLLWNLSGAMTFSVGGTDWNIPGYLVWIALLYAGIGSGLTLVMGRPLVQATDARQSNEAAFRFGLVRVRENAEGIALLRGEADERRRLLAAFTGIQGAWNRQTSGQRRLILLTNAYSTLAGVFPLIISLPQYFAGVITLGGLMQTAQAFVQVQSALSWFVDNFPRFAEWQASAERVLGLHEGLDDLQADAESKDGTSILLVQDDDSEEGPRLVFEQLGIAHPDGTFLVSDADATIELGERVLIMGESGTGKSTLLRAVAGLWPWGRGTIRLPMHGRMVFMPQRPYLPIGPLRVALLYPSAPDATETREIEEALRKVNLDHLIERLDQTEQWDRVLSGGEQQRLAFARLLLHKPDWVFLDEATAALDEENQVRMMELLASELPHVSVISIGHRPGLEVFHERQLVLIHGKHGATLETYSGRRRQARSQARESRAESLLRRLAAGLKGKRSTR